jgi:cobyric acid synthase
VSSYFDSTVLLSQEDEATVRGFFPADQSIRFELLYRGSRDGTSSAAFHQKVDNQGPTLVLVKTEHSRVCGGYQSLSYKVVDIDQYESDESAFLFSVTFKTKHTQFKRIKWDSIRHSLVDDYTLCYGGGCDLIVQNNYDKTDTNFSNFGVSYQLPEGLIQDSPEAEAYLGGSFNFKVTELEVFCVIFS